MIIYALADYTNDLEPAKASCLSPEAHNELAVSPSRAVPVVSALHGQHIKSLMAISGLIRRRPRSCPMRTVLAAHDWSNLDRRRARSSSAPSWPPSPCWRAVRAVSVMFWQRGHRRPRRRLFATSTHPSEQRSRC